MGRLAIGLVATSGLLVLVLIAFAVVLFGLGVSGILDEKVFHNGLIHVLGLALEGVMLVIGPPG